MKINKQKDSLMRRHTQTVRGNEHTKEDFGCIEYSDGLITEKCDIQCPFCKKWY